MALATRAEDSGFNPITLDKALALEVETRQKEFEKQLQTIKHVEDLIVRCRIALRMYLDAANAFHLAKISGDQIAIDVAHQECECLKKPMLDLGFSLAGYTRCSDEQIQSIAIEGFVSVFHIFPQDIGCPTSELKNRFLHR